MRRDGALIERFAGRTLVLWQLLLIWHQRRVGCAGQVGLALLSLSFATLALLALHGLGLGLLVGGVVGLIHAVLVALALAAAGVALA